MVPAQQGTMATETSGFPFGALSAQSSPVFPQETLSLLAFTDMIDPFSQGTSSLLVYTETSCNRTRMSTTGQCNGTEGPDLSQ